MTAPSCSCRPATASSATTPFTSPATSTSTSCAWPAALPLVVPNALDSRRSTTLLDLADGVLLTGSPSNVHPRHFDEGCTTRRCRWTPSATPGRCRFIPQVLARGVPLFAICRGTQEINVALGGTLHQAVQEVAGLWTIARPSDERSPSCSTALRTRSRWCPVAAVAHRRPARFEVNSVHGQGVKRLAQGLRVEARAPDGLIEAFSDAEAAGFNLCVQWHPEWQASINPVSMQLAQAFGEACQAYRRQYRERLP